jgi:hypothetical protein
MKTKILVMLIALLTMIGFTACVTVGKDGVNVKAPGTEVDVGQDGVNVKAPGTEVDVGQDGVNVKAPGTEVDVDQDGVNVGNSHNSSNSDATLKALTPPGATVTANAGDGEAILTSNQSLAELVAFYKKALQDLGAKEESALEYAGTWNYRGTYNGGKAISIQITGRTISITY